MIEMKKTLSTALALIVLVSLHSTPVFANKQAQYQGLQQWCMVYLDWNKKQKRGQSGGVRIEVPTEYFSGVGHYCSAIDAYHKLQATSDKNHQRYLLGLVIGETGYVVGHNAETHPHTAELYALRGRAQLFLNHNPKAEESLNKALQLDPRYTDVYASLGNLYLNTNRKPKAAEVTQTGLAIDPQHRALRRLAGKLGIKLEEVKAESDKPQPPSSAELKQSDSAELIQELKPTLPPPSSASAETEPPKQDVDKAAKEARRKSSDFEALPTHTGTPRNPWCRFCPDMPVKADPKADPLPSNP